MSSLATLPRSTDVAVVGGGPVGCVTALALARRGARVVLLEAEPRAAQRLAGEWLHPPGVRVLERLGLGSILAAAGCCPGRGFVVHPDDGSQPIVLDYVGPFGALSCEHSRLVSILREAVRASPGICYISGVQAIGLARDRLSFAERRAGRSGTVLVQRVVGADGRSSSARTWLGIPHSQASRVSSMAGLLLEDADLPSEQFGHVFLGGPGPALVYRIGPRHIRACLDVPLASAPDSETATALWEAFAAALPAELRPSLRRAVQERRITWAANQHRPRTHYGRGGLALVGDAVGVFHPLTAVGMTVGFMDGECLARSPGLGAYRRERAARSRVAELLAASLYRLFTLQDAGSVALRQAVYRVWRREPAERRRTMRLLSGDETNEAQFARAFLKVMGSAARGVCADTTSGPQRRELIDRLGQWLRWLAASTLVGPVRMPVISETPPPLEQSESPRARAGKP